MKSEFALAFNQICAEYSLPREVVLDAICAALATAYRRDWKVPATQNVSADINWRPDWRASMWSAWSPKLSKTSRSRSPLKSPPQEG